MICISENNPLSKLGQIFLVTLQYIKVVQGFPLYVNVEDKMTLQTQLPGNTAKNWIVCYINVMETDSLLNCTYVLLD